MPTEFILILILSAVVFLLFLTFISRYKRCPSNKILVIYGKTGGGTAAKCVHGGAAFVLPLLQDYEYLDLEPFVVPIDLDNALSQENIRVSVPTTVTAAISNQPGIMQNAAIRLLGLSRDQIQSQAQDIILGQMRAVIATMQIEEINQDRQAFMTKVNDAVSTEMEKIGLAVINVNIKDLDDESGYIKAIGQKAAAEAINQASIDVAEQERHGQVGVAERARDRRREVAAAESEADVGEAEATRNRRRQVAALESEAEIGEAEAGRDKRQNVAALEAEAVQSETEAEAKTAGYRAGQRVQKKKRAEKQKKLPKPLTAPFASPKKPRKKQPKKPGHCAKKRACAQKLSFRQKPKNNARSFKQKPKKNSDALLPKVKPPLFSHKNRPKPRGLRPSSMRKPKDTDNSLKPVAATTRQQRLS